MLKKALSRTLFVFHMAPLTSNDLLAQQKWAAPLINFYGDLEASIAFFQQKTQFDLQGLNLKGVGADWIICQHWLRFALYCSVLVSFLMFQQCSCVFFSLPLSLQDTPNSSWSHRRPIHHRHSGAQRGRLCSPQKHQKEEGLAAFLGDRGERVEGRANILGGFSSPVFSECFQLN